MNSLLREGYVEGSRNPEHRKTAGAIFSPDSPKSGVPLQGDGTGASVAGKE